VAAAATAEEALKKLDSEAPDVILLDIWLPGIDGTDALKEIKAKFPGLPV
jgi:two-component system nitrogen regulation response regulator NtrX